jgi:deoxyribodipyrimidine photo-lyase
MTAIWWIRRDLRLNANPTLQEAIKYKTILPVFVLDQSLLKNNSNRRQNFLISNLHKLGKDLKDRGSYLVIREGRPVDVLGKLVGETGAEVILAEEDYTPYDRLRSVLVGGSLPLKLVQGQLGIHPLGNLKNNGKPYTVFSPFKRNWQSILPVINSHQSPRNISTISGISSIPLPEYQQDEQFPAGEKTARDRLEEYLENGVGQYHVNRDRLDGIGTSALSPYIHLGVLSLRELYEISGNLLNNTNQMDQPTGLETWVSELIWREFFIHILYHFPEVRTQNFRKKYDDVLWRNNIGEYNAWKSGRTGYPVVDAAMRQLNKTGWLSNRARMVAASFLVKHLLIDWRWGEQYFRDQLIDGDLAVNNGNWQWVAGTGTDAAPYFRIFNPVLQSRKFDPDGSYLRDWLPELSHLSDKEIHAPWEYDVDTGNYPLPIVDHSFARERALIAYRSVSK